MSDVHVVTSEDGWALEVDGQQRGSFDTQGEAVRQGRQLAEQEQGELVIHGEGGQVCEKDPCRPRKMGRPTDARSGPGDKAVLSHHDSERTTEMPRMYTNEVALGYDLAGTGETLVLVHGSWSDRNNWQAVAPELARSFRVVTYDRRGHGASQRDIEGSRRNQEDDLAALIEGLGCEPVNVAGTSFGAAIAVGLAARRPELVRSLIAHEPPLTAVVSEAEVRARLEVVMASVRTVVARVEHGDALGAARQFVEEVALGPGAWKLLPEPLRETMVDSAPAFVAEQRDPMWLSVELDELATIECPVLLTQGDESPAWFHPIVAKLAEAIEHAEVHTYRGAGHAPHLTNPGDYLATVTGFLSRVPVG